MARYTGPKVRVSRRLGTNIFENEKGRKAYERDNPGSNLKPPVSKEQAAKSDASAARRKSFCARMEGMKRKNTSEKTKNDPNSRINKSLRAWNCK